MCEDKETLDLRCRNNEADFNLNDLDLQNFTTFIKLVIAIKITLYLINPGLHRNQQY